MWKRRIDLHAPSAKQQKVYHESNGRKGCYLAAQPARDGPLLHSWCSLALPTDDLLLQLPSPSSASWYLDKSGWKLVAVSEELARTRDSTAAVRADTWMSNHDEHICSCAATLKAILWHLASPLPYILRDRRLRVLVAVQGTKWNVISTRILVNLTGNIQFAPWSRC